MTPFLSDGCKVTSLAVGRVKLAIEGETEHV
jgi:hypothetical protein